MKIRVGVISALILLSSCDDPDKQANRLVVEAAKTLHGAELQSSPEEQLRSVNRALQLLNSITEKYPGSHIAARLVTDQQVGIVQISKLEARSAALTKKVKKQAQIATCERSLTVDCALELLSPYLRNDGERRAFLYGLFAAFVENSRFREGDRADRRLSLYSQSQQEAHRISYIQELRFILRVETEGPESLEKEQWTFTDKSARSNAISAIMNFWVKRGDISEARRILHENQTVVDKWGWYRLIVGLTKSGDIPSALEHAAAMKGDDQPGAYSRILWHLATTDQDQAIRIFEKDVPPTIRDKVIGSLLTGLVEGEHFEHAFLLAETASDSVRDEVHERATVKLVDARRYAEANDAIGKIKSPLGRIQTQMNMALAYFRDGNATMARHYEQQLAESARLESNEKEDAFVALGKIQLQQGHVDAARVSFAAAIKASKFAREEIVQAWIASGSIEEAFDWLGREDTELLNDEFMLTYWGTNLVVVIAYEWASRLLK